MAAETMESKAHRKIAHVAIDFSKVLNSVQLERWRKTLAATAAEPEVMAARSIKGTQVDTKRNTTAHNSNFTE
jgi:hypothetical protein